MSWRTAKKSALPEGLVYAAEFVTADEERELVRSLGRLELRAPVMHGVAALRATAHFGWLYGYETWRIERGPPVPFFLLPLRAAAASLARLAPEELAEVLVTRYPPGAGIGWHRDAPMFGPAVVGVSLGSACKMRFRREGPTGKEVAELELAPRSAYVLSGPARSQWQHGITRCPGERWSVTFRTLRGRFAEQPEAHP